jgi:hypothetical protein
VAPPGDAANNIKPTANSGDKPKLTATNKHINGSKSIWQKSPINIAFGNLTTRVKSAIVSDKPKPNIIMPNAIGIKTVVRLVACIVNCYIENKKSNYYRLNKYNHKNF